MVILGDLESARGGITSRVYTNILRDNLLRILSYDSIYIHDNIPIHTALIVESHLKEEHIDIVE